MLSRSVVRRFASAATAQNVSSPKGMAPIEESVSRHGSGLRIASVDMHGAGSQLLMAFKAGARYEQVDEVGLVHQLRNSIGTNAANFAGLKLLWQIENIGASVVATASKDLFFVRISAPRTHANVALSLLGELSKPVFKPWDAFEVSNTMPGDLSRQEPLDLIVEMLHKAAYRNGPMGNSLLSSPSEVGQIKSHQLTAFAASRFIPSEAALIGVNVDHSVLLDYANSQEWKAGTGAKQDQPSVYIGGDMRISGRTNLAHVAIGGQGAKLADVKSVAVQSVLSFVIGKAPNVKYASTPGLGPVAKSVLQVANHNEVGVNALNIVHSDSGLAGVYLVTNGDKIGAYVKAAVSGLKELGSSGPDEETLSIAKKLAELETHVNSQCCASLAIDRAAQLLVGQNAVSPAEFAKAIQEVSVGDVKKAASQMVSKLSVAAYGKIHQVPYADQL